PQARAQPGCRQVRRWLAEDLAGDNSDGLAQSGCAQNDGNTAQQKLARNQVGRVTPCAPLCRAVCRRARSDAPYRNGKATRDLGRALRVISCFGCNRAHRGLPVASLPSYRYATLPKTPAVDSPYARMSRNWNIPLLMTDSVSAPRGRSQDPSRSAEFLSE